jgi:hypothetical protein
VIVVWALSPIYAFFMLIVGWLPTDPPPSWVSDANGLLSQIWGWGAGLGAWVPWQLIGVVVAAVLACALIGFLIKIVRIVASFLTLGGGSAA